VADQVPYASSPNLFGLPVEFLVESLDVDLPAVLRELMFEYLLGYPSELTLGLVGVKDALVTTSSANVSRRCGRHVAGSPLEAGVVLILASPLTVWERMTTRLQGRQL